MTKIVLTINDKKKIIGQLGRIYREVDDKEMLKSFDEFLAHACHHVIEMEREKIRLSFQDDVEKIKSLTKRINQTLLVFKE